MVGVGRIERHGEPDDSRWVAEGIPALERVLQGVGLWLGAVERDQARDVMTAFTRQVRLKGTRTHYKRGHLYDRRIAMSSGCTRGYCNQCARIGARRIRAAQGIPPRQFTNVARRYTE